MTDILTAYNALHVTELSRLLREGAVACLVGAGTSIACGYPGWSAFLDELKSPLRRKLRDDYLAELEKRDVRTRLDEISSLLADEYPRIFRATFEPRGDGSSVPEWLRLILDLPVAILLTTNYTCELEQAARFHPSSPLKENPDAIRWYDAAAVSRALRRIDARTRLVYIHGRYDDWPGTERDHEGREWSRIVLGEKSYAYAYEYPGAIKERFRGLLQTHTLLVIGASLQDEDLTGTLRFAKALGGTDPGRHYVILPIRPDMNPRLRAADYLDRFNLQPLFYPLGDEAGTLQDHGGLQELLRDLVQRVMPIREHHSPRAADPTAAGEYPPRPRVVHPLLRASNFQPRPIYRRAIDEFARRREGGVLALVGIGGAGKTALVRDALDELLATRVPQRLDGTFVWSFYDESDSHTFFRNLVDYLGAGPLPDIEDEFAVYERLRRACNPDARILCVLDGLEKLQIERPGQTRVHGAIDSTSLRQFLLWLAQADVALRAIVTTRFPLPDLEPEARTGRVQLLQVDALTRPQARSLLRSRGVRGNDSALDLVLDHYGAHALTLDHLGGLLAEYLEGDPGRFRELGDGALTRFEVGHTYQKMARVVAAYAGYIARSEPEVRDTLVRVAIFPRAIGAKLLGEVFLRPERARHAGTLAGKTQLELVSYLRRLVSLRLLHEDRADNETLYSLHPAVRGVVLEMADDARPGLAAAASEELRNVLDRPPIGQSSRDNLDLVEDLIGFCVDQGDVQRAIELYRDRLAGDRALGPRLGEYSRAERVTRRLLAAVAPAEGYLLHRRYYPLVNALATILQGLGRLEEAADLLFNEAPASEHPYRVARWLITLSELQVYVGRLRAAEEYANRAVLRAGEAKDEYAQERAVGLQARAAFWRGDVLRFFTLAARRARGRRFITRGSDFVIALIRCERLAEAIACAESIGSFHRKKRWQEPVARLDVFRAEALRQLNHLGRAEESVRAANAWALSAGQHEILVWARLVGSRLSRDRGDLLVAVEQASDGLRLGEACGFGLLAIDLRIATAELALMNGDAESAQASAERVLEMTNDPECDYFWGRLDAHEVLARIYRVRGDAERTAHHARWAETLRIRTLVSDEALRPLLAGTVVEC